MSKTSTSYGAGAPANWGLSGEHRFRSILVNSVDPIICANSRGEINFVNRAAQQLFGYDRQELLGQGLTMLMPLDYRETHTHALAEYMATRKRRASNVPNELYALHRDGTRIPIEITVSNCETDGGTIFSATIRDLRGREQRHTDGRVGRESFRALLSATRDPIFVLEEQGTISDCNATAARILGLPRPENLVGRSFFDCFISGDVERVRKYLAAPSMPENAARVDLSMRRQDGVEVPVDLSVVGAPVGGADAPALLGIVHDKSAGERAKAHNREREEKLQLTLRGTVAALSATVEIRDPYIAGHQSRVAELSLAIAVEMGLPSARAQGVHTAGMLHDIGKIHVPPDILSKREVLSDFEMRVIQAHAQAGQDLLKDIEFPCPVATAIGQHHERLDGSGYPDGLCGKYILLEARILAVADVVEAMSSTRPHRDAHTLEEAIAEINAHSGVLYDANVVAICSSLFGGGHFRFGVRRTALPAIAFGENRSA